MFVREHNRIADYLAHLNPHWTDETIFQETRRIVIAEHQNIAYYEWLPIFLGLNIYSIIFSAFSVLFGTLITKLKSIAIIVSLFESNLEILDTRFGNTKFNLFANHSYYTFCLFM